VADFAVQAVHNENLLNPASSYTLAISASTEGGYTSVEESLASVREQPEVVAVTTKNKPYGVAVGLLVYSLGAVALRVAVSVVKLVGRLCKA